MRIRVVLITQGISRVVGPVLQEQDIEIVGIAESAPRSFDLSEKGKLSIRRLVVAIRAMAQRSRSLKNVADQNSIPYLLLHKGNQEQFVDWLRTLHVDLVLIYSMSQLLPPEILAIPRLGVLNLHPSLLPAYRGANPWFWMYHNMEKQGGVTLHYVDAGEDTGDIVCQRTYEIPLGLKSPEMQDMAIGTHGVEMILEALKMIGKGTPLPRMPQSPQSTTQRARNIKPEEHRTLINWQEWSIERIWHVMSGTELWLNCIDQPRGIFTGQRWEVLGFERKVHPVKLDDLGKIGKDVVGHYVRCRDGIIRLYVRFSLAGYARYIFKRLTK